VSGWLSGTFLVLLAVHTVYALRKSLAKPRTEDGALDLSLRFSVVFQSVIFILAAVLAYRGGVISRDLVSPVAIAIGLLAGHLIFGISLLVTHRSIEDAHSHFLDFNSLWDFVAEHPYVLSRFIYVGISEEIIWRAAAQPALSGLFKGMLGGGVDSGWAAVAAVGVVAVAFSVVHDHFFQNGLLVTVEFLGFALLLGGLYYWTGSLIMVIIIHAVRDIEIAYLEYAINVHELGDEEKAAKEVEKVYRRDWRNQP
jgi:membrane protease YdiL (CAAX protease family)